MVTSRMTSFWVEDEILGNDILIDSGLRAPTLGADASWRTWAGTREEQDSRLDMANENLDTVFLELAK